MSDNHTENPVTMSSDDPMQTRQTPPRASVVTTLVLVVSTTALLGVGASLYLRAQARVNKIALAESAKPVTVITARAGTFRPQRRYVATVEPWIEARVGPQFIAAYADTVLVRPGAAVKRGQVLATLDCRDANATQRAVAAEARAIEAKQKALADEATRINSLLDGGYVAPNEAEQKLAGSESELAELMATQAKLASSSLAVNDCVLRAPFDGEIGDRMVDPGAFVRPGTSIVSVVDRSTVRVVAEVPEDDFAYVAPGTTVQMTMLATGQTTSGTLARRSPAVSASTRTVHIEIDVPDPKRQLPVGTTAELTVDVGTSQPATLLPDSAATVRGNKAVVFEVENGVAKKAVIPVEGARAGTLYLDTSLAAGTKIVSEGRSLLEEGDHVVAAVAP